MLSTPPIIEQIEGFTVTGFSVRTQNSHEFNQETAKLPILWQQFHASELNTNSKVFGVYSNYQSDENGSYTVTVGISNNQKNIEYQSIQIHSGRYLVFKEKGAMPQAVIMAWQRVWSYFKEGTDQRSFLSDFEAYNHKDEVMLYIGIS